MVTKPLFAELNRVVCDKQMTPNQIKRKNLEQLWIALNADVKEKLEDAKKEKAEEERKAAEIKNKDQAAKEKQDQQDQQDQQKKADEERQKNKEIKSGLQAIGIYNYDLYDNKD